jgi:hypothetical protein
MFPRKIKLEGLRALHLSADFTSGLLGLHLKACSSTGPHRFLRWNRVPCDPQKLCVNSWSLVGVGSGDAARLTARIRQVQRTLVVARDAIGKRTVENWVFLRKAGYDSTDNC